MICQEQEQDHACLGPPASIFTHPHPTPPRPTPPSYIGPSLLSSKGELLRKHITGRNVLIVTNTKVGPLYLDKVAKVLKADPNTVVDTLVLPDGEEYKSMEILSKITDKVGRHQNQTAPFVRLSPNPNLHSTPLHPGHGALPRQTLHLRRIRWRCDR